LKLPLNFYKICEILIKFDFIVKEPKKFGCEAGKRSSDENNKRMRNVNSSVS